MAQATAPLSEYAEKARRDGGAVVVTLRGKPIANHPEFLAIMEQSRAAHREQGGISPDEMREHFGIKPKRRTRAKR